ncbi:MAG: toxin-antitoxin system HicB family antitoxin [Desulfobacterales bacterium]|nr:toxin-antitoxin system HicB family antitoxin [Desulfobacterales bacterium]
MGTLTIRLPDDTHNRIKVLAKYRGISTNKLFEELTTIALTEFDTESRFRSRAERGSRKRGLELLSKLDKTAEAK